MAFSILGTGSYVPKCVVTNDMISKIVDTSDEWISSRTGIKQRHIMTDETMTDMSATAAQRALDNAGVSAKDIDLIICSTFRGDYISPSQACIIQRVIGANCPAFDTNGACSGFIYALDVAASYFLAKKVKKVLVVAVDAMTKLADWTDRSTCVLFGDGAGAVVLGEGDDLLSIRITAEGNEAPLNIPHVGGNCPFDQSEHKPSFLYMNGQDVYKFAVRAIVKEFEWVLNDAKITTDDIDYMLLHQANLRIIETAQKKLNVDVEKYIMNIHEYGNTSSASIPITLDDMFKANKLKNNQLLAMVSFGGGFTTGVCIIRWNSK